MKLKIKLIGRGETSGKLPDKHHSISNEDAKLIQPTTGVSKSADETTISKNHQLDSHLLNPGVSSM